MRWLIWQLVAGPLVFLVLFVTIVQCVAVPDSDACEENEDTLDWLEFMILRGGKKQC